MTRFSTPTCAALALTFAIAACSKSGGDSGGDAGGDDGAAATTGKLSFRFAIDENQAAVMAEPPSGTFYGGIFVEADVTPVGTVEGAVALETFAVEVALTMDGTPTEALHTTGDLPVGKLYMIGFLDSDGNSPAETAPDSGDPVTAPGYDDRFEVVGGEITECDVLLDLLMP